MFGIREDQESKNRMINKLIHIHSEGLSKHESDIDFLKREFIALKYKVENPPKYKIGELVNGIIVSSVEWLDGYGTAFFGWTYYGVKKGSDKLIEVK